MLWLTRRYFDRRLDEIEEILKAMPTRAELDAAKAELTVAIKDASDRVVATITALQGQIANGSPITAADLDDLKSDVAALAQIDAAPSPNPPVP